MQYIGTSSIMVQGWGVADRKVVTCPLFVACHSYLRRSLTTLSLKLKMTDSPNTTDIVHPLVSSLELEPGLLYAVLTYRGDLASWNWSFFVPNPSVFPIGADGTVFHVVSDSDTPGEWKFEMENKDVVGSPLVVVIVRLGDVACLGDYEDVVGGDGSCPCSKHWPFRRRVRDIVQSLALVHGSWTPYACCTTAASLTATMCGCLRGRSGGVHSLPWISTCKTRVGRFMRQNVVLDTGLLCHGLIGGLFFEVNLDFGHDGGCLVFNVR